MILKSGKFFSGMFYCMDYKKRVSSGYPITLYHATTDKNSVCEEGLKPSYQVERSALGQFSSNDDNFISFTITKKIAINIAKDLINLIKIINEKITFDNIEGELDKSDDEGKIIINKNYSVVVDEKTDVEGTYIQSPFNKNEYIYKLNPKKIYYQELSKKPSEIWKDVIKKEKEKSDKWYEHVKVKDTSKREKEIMVLFDLWRKYLGLRELIGGRHDCWFAQSSNPLTLKGLKPSDVGICQVKAFLESNTIEFSDSSTYYFEAEYKKNDFEYKSDLKISSFSLKGEVRNLEVRIPKERFTDLKLIPIPNKIELPEDVIILKRLKKSLV